MSTEEGELQPVCSACGSPVTPQLGSCSWCGRPVAAAVVPIETDEKGAPTAAPTDGRPPKPGHARRRWLVGGGVAGGIAAVAVVVILLTTGGGDPAPAATDQRARDARDVAAALATLASDPGALRAGSSSLAGVDPAAAVPAGSTVDADESSWQPDGAGGGVMSVSLTTPDGSSTTYLAVVVRQDDGWKILQTVTAPAANASSSPTAVTS